MLPLFKKAPVRFERASRVQSQAPFPIQIKPLCVLVVFVFVSVYLLVVGCGAVDLFEMAWVARLNAVLNPRAP